LPKFAPVMIFDVMSNRNSSKSS